MTLYAREASHVAEMAATGVNARRLPGVPLLSNVTPTADLAAAADADVFFAVVPAQALRGVLQNLAPLLGGGAPVVVCAKGIEHGTGRFLSEVVSETLPGHPPAVLSGPSFAQDVAHGLPTAVTLAAADDELAATLAGLLAAPNFRVYSATDVRGVEIGGAAKNVLAIANGVTAGRELGASAGAALLARGFAELTRFGRAYGADPATLMGLSGLGDLVLTCTSALSRNFLARRGAGARREPGAGNGAHRPRGRDLYLRRARRSLQRARRRHADRQRRRRRARWAHHDRRRDRRIAGAALEAGGLMGLACFT